MMAEGLVSRQRLFDLLSSPPEIRVVAAPSGFGKTTLLRSWVDAQPARERVLVWVALSAEVATREDFWQLVGASAYRHGAFDATAYQAVASEVQGLHDPVPLMAEFIDQHGPGLLVLDAYEHLRGLTVEIDRDLIRLVNTAAGLDVVVTTRATTTLVDDVRVMRGQVRTIGEADLRFTTDEVAQLLELHAPHAVDAAERIAQDTRGYPLAVRAVAHALARLGSTPAYDSHVWHRLVTEDLRSQIADPQLADFVLDTSVPPYFDRGLAGQLVDGAGVDRALAELAWNGFGRWIPYARERPVFQYVESVRDVFLAQLRADHPERHARAAGLAAAWLHRHGDHDLALALAIDARQYDLASSICRSLVIANPDVYTTNMFERHLRRVPRRLLPRYPVLAFIRGMIYAANPATRGAAAEYLRITARHALDDIDRLSPPEAFYHHIGREVCLRYLGRSQEAGAAAAAGSAFYDSMSAADREAIEDFAPMALSLLAYSLFQVAELDQASILLERAATAAADQWWKNYALAIAVGIHALSGRLPDARAALAMIDPDAVPSGGSRRQPHVLGILGRAALRLDDLDLTGVLCELDAGRSLVEIAESWPFIAWVRLHAHLGLGEAAGEAHQVEEILAAKSPRLGVGPNLGTAALVNVLAVCWLAEGRDAKAHRLLRTRTPWSGQLAPGRMLKQLVSGDPASAVRDVVGRLAEPGHTIRSTAAVETLGAAAALRAGNDDTAAELLERAASRHGLFGVRAHLMYLPDADLDALRKLASVRRSRSCEAYLGASVATPIAAIDAAPVLLTPREIEVLRALARHRTRADVARALFVSANTVKSQLNSAYRKLGVTTKDAAIQRAIELDLLHPAER